MYILTFFIPLSFIGIFSRAQLIIAKIIFPSFFIGTEITAT